MFALEGMPAEPSFGQDAVERASAQGDLAGAEAPAPYAEKGVGEIVRFVGARTFVNASGVWIDTAFDPEGMTTTPVAFLSPDYFALLQARPELASAFALGERVIAFADGVVYEVVPADMAVDPLDVPRNSGVDQRDRASRPKPSAHPCPGRWGVTDASACAWVSTWLSGWLAAAGCSSFGGNPVSSSAEEIER